MTIEVNVDTSKFDRMMADFPAALARAQKSALKVIGAEVKSQAERAFKHPHYRPSPWAPRKPSYIVKVNKKTGKKTKKLDVHPLLIKSGTLSQSIESKMDGDDTVVVGSSQEYAGYHQFGTKHMPARPFMPIDENGNLLPRVQRKINKIVEEALAEEMEKTFGH